MKKIISFLLLVAVFLGANVALAETTSSAAVNNYLAQLQLLRGLRQGMTGDDVAVLQAYLATHPDVYPEGLITGTYGPLTAKAVAKFQRKVGLEAVGQVGPLTRAQINALLRKDAVGDEDRGNGKKEFCAKIPPGHLIAPGLRKKQPGDVTIPTCQNLPPGIAKKLGMIGTTTPGTTTPLTISSLAASSTGATTTVIKWTTNKFANGKIWYSTSTPVSFATTTPMFSQGNFTLSHVFGLGNLATSTTYYYIVSSATIFGETATSVQASFITPAQ